MWWSILKMYILAELTGELKKEKFVILSVLKSELLFFL